ncbi:hypothetical protein EAO70_09350 [Streptomyces sp. adm13(2018)]|uniref:hypothetical protein n=1 Tax=Streptomyces sp. adm13(2018) TaxID=2479007 RepID=UPI0011CD5666|nr:hypothetical protein [Streptomyces sp. adm13(2018)]TXS20208.1 hypothetical protein EAO70_09350 [Streptomyces sp. adm13(2018)]
MATTSRVPAAVNALLALLKAAPALAGVRIVDGPPSVNLTERRVLYVGWQRGSDLAVSLEQDFNAAGARTRDETFVIGGYIESRSGDKDAAALHRDRAFEILAAVEDALRATDAAPTAPTLNNTVLWAHIVTGDLFQEQSEGTLVGLNFSVACRARI